MFNLLQRFLQRTSKKRNSEEHINCINNVIDEICNEKKRANLGRVAPTGARGMSDGKIRGLSSGDANTRGCVDASCGDLGWIAERASSSTQLVKHRYISRIQLGSGVLGVIKDDLGDLYAESGQTLQGSFSAVSKTNFASKYSLESS